jgi:hypothetical protein
LVNQFKLLPPERSPTAMMVPVREVSAREDVPRTPTGVRIMVGPVVVRFRVDPRCVIHSRLGVDAPFRVNRRRLVKVMMLDDALALDYPWAGRTLDHDIALPIDRTI